MSHPRWLAAYSDSSMINRPVGSVIHLSARCMALPVLKTPTGSNNDGIQNSQQLVIKIAIAKSLPAIIWAVINFCGWNGGQLGKTCFVSISIQQFILFAMLLTYLYKINVWDWTCQVLCLSSVDVYVMITADKKSQQYQYQFYKNGTERIREGCIAEIVHATFIFQYLRPRLTNHGKWQVKHDRKNSASVK